VIEGVEVVVEHDDAPQAAQPATGAADAGQLDGDRHSPRISPPRLRS
jgi:hypothetical protein